MGLGASDGEVYLRLVALLWTGRANSEFEVWGRGEGCYSDGEAGIIYLHNDQTQLPV